MPVMSGFGTLAELPWERITDKIERRMLAGKQGMIVWWKMKAGAHAAAHQHPHEQIVWMFKGRMDFRIGNDRRSMIAGDVAVIPGNVEYEGLFPHLVRTRVPALADYTPGPTNGDQTNIARTTRRSAAAAQRPRQARYAGRPA